MILKKKKKLQAYKLYKQCMPVLLSEIKLAGFTLKLLLRKLDHELVGFLDHQGLQIQFWSLSWTGAW